MHFQIEPSCVLAALVCCVLRCFKDCVMTVVGVGVCLQANLAAVKVLPTRSAAVRSYADSHLLEALAGRLATVALSGFMFFGSSVLMSDKVGHTHTRTHRLLVC